MDGYKFQKESSSMRVLVFVFGLIQYLFVFLNILKRMGKEENERNLNLDFFSSFINIIYY